MLYQLHDSASMCTILYICYLSLTCHVDPPAPHSFPTRRSSDLAHGRLQPAAADQLAFADELLVLQRLLPPGQPRRCRTDRKSTRLNSSHLVISYAVFCLKKKRRKISSARVIFRSVIKNQTIYVN